MQSQAASGAEHATARAEALRRLAAFVPRAGRTYAAERNYDRGNTDRANVSTLSPYIRHRVLTESEVLRAVLARHSAAAAEKFVQEVFWRTYWKGWLQAHPTAWSRYIATLDAHLAQLATVPDDQRSYDDAVHGRTGIDAFDAWASELVETNYLHNHARMWFASIWIFTLGLPWELGADFFMRDLLDGDPASNTLSWRWVAGLQTRGKAYVATRDNIRRYTHDRFALTATLARSPVALDDAAIPVQALPVLRIEPLAAQPTLFVLHDDDLHGDGADLPAGVRGVAAIRAAAGRSPRPLHPAVLRFSDTVARESIAAIAMATGAVDCGLVDTPDVESAAAGLIAAAAACGAQRIVAPFAPVGPVRELLDGLGAIFVRQGLEYVETGRRYDAVSWPAATRGFFALRARIPAIAAELGLRSG